MVVPVTHFAGRVTARDLTSGLNCGSVPVQGFKGSFQTRGLKGHMYSASISGIAYFGTSPVAQTKSNYITWKP